MIRCCYCGIILYIAPSIDYGYTDCPSCNEEIFVLVPIGQSFKNSQIYIDQDTKTINIKHENEHISGQDK